MSNTSSEYKNPWLDIASYQLNDAYRFKGREEDVEKFMSIINNRTMSVLYANSGIGKTSFINAGIIPQIIAMGFIPIHISFPEIVFDSRDVEGWLYKRLFSLENENANRSDGNKYYWNSHTNEKIEGCETSLWWLLHTAKIHESGSNNTYTPLIVFDQFEELFVKSQQLGSLGGGFLEDFFSIIQDMASKAVPRNLSQKLEEKINREGRFISIGSVHDYKVVFSLRKEYLSDFDYWTNDKFIIPELYRNRMYLLPLTREQAERVIIQQPNPEKEGEYIDTLNDVKDIILDKIDDRKTNEIEPLMLSVLCSRLNDEAMSKGIKHLTKQDVESINIDTLIATFYDDIVKDVIKDAKLLSEFEEQMVDKDNHRNKVKSLQLLDGKFDKQYKKELEDKHIIRVEKYNGEDYVELIHDRLCDVIKERRIHRKNRELNLQRRKNRMNVLTPQGRRLIDNELEFDYDPAKYKSDLRWVLDDNIRTVRMMEKIANDKKTWVDDSYVSTDFRKILEDTTSDNTSIRLGFVDKSNNSVVTSDGIDCIDLSFNGSDQITQIIFRGTIRQANGLKSYEPFYLRGGYCGIRIEYDGVHEKSRTYLQYNGNDFVPIQTAEGYATIEFDEYDEFGFPQRTMFKDSDGESKMHNSGNFGFVSKYDEDGYEIQRIFVDKNWKTQKLLSGIYARQLDYDRNTGFLKEEINLNIELKPSYDINGYCKVVFNRDKWGRIIKESYYDKENSLCLCQDGYAVEVTEYLDSYENKHSYSWYLDEEGLPVPHKDGYWKARYDYDSSNYIFSMAFGHDHSATGVFIQRKKSVLLYDKLHYIVGIKNYKGKNDYNEGYWLEYNKEYTHVVRMGGLNEDGTRCNLTSFDVPMMELRENKNDLSRPLLRVFLDEEGMPTKCNDGYKAFIRWEEQKKWLNDDTRIVKEMYYDEHGNPMYDTSKCYGHRWVYDDNNLITRMYNLDKNGIDCNDVHGILYTETEYDTNGNEKKTCWYDSNNMRCPSDGLFGIEHHWSDNDLLHTIICLDEKECPTDKEQGFAYTITEKDDRYPDMDKRTYKLKQDKNYYIDKEGFCVTEYLYNDDGKLIGFLNANSDGRLLMTNNGYAGVRIETSCDGSIDKTVYFDDTNSPAIGYPILEIHYDNNRREIFRLQYDNNHQRQEFDSGVYGIRTEYSETDNTKKIIYLDENDKVLYMQLIGKDMRGRKIIEISYDESGNPIQTPDGDFGKLYDYIDQPDKRVKIETSIDQNRNPMVNNYGYSIMEMVLDENGYPIKTAVYDTERRPYYTDQGFHSINTYFEYDQSGSKTVTVLFLDIYDNPCQDKSGVAKSVIRYDSLDRPVQEYQMNRDGEMIMFDNGVYIKKTEYEDENTVVKSFHSKDGSLMNDNDGVALTYIKTEENKVEKIRYDSSHNIIVDDLGDYGEIVYTDNDTKLRIGLDRKGNPHVNSKGFFAQKIMEIGESMYYLYFDENGNPAKCNDGFYGIKKEQPDASTTITTTLDANLNPYVPQGRGYAIQEVTEYESGKVTRIFWRDTNGNPFVDVDGDSGFKIIKYDKSIEVMEFLDRDGNTHINYRNRAKIKTTSNEGWRKELWLDVYDNPIANNDGDYGVLYEFDEGGDSTMVSFLDSEGNPHKNSEGWTYRKIISHTDSEIQEVYYYDKEMRPWADSDGDVAFRKEINDTGAIIFTSLDAQGNVVDNNNGYAKRLVELDDKDRVIHELWFDVNGEPVCNDKGEYGRRTIYYDITKDRIQQSLDINGNPKINVNGYAMRQQCFDEDGRVIQEMWLDEQGLPIMDKDTGCSGIRMYFIDDSNMEILINLDNKMQPCNDLQGRSIVKIWRDSYNRKIKTMSFDVFGNPVCDDDGDYGTKFIYTDDANMVILESLGPDGNPYINRYGYRKEIRFINESYSIYLDDKDTPITRSGQELQDMSSEIIENVATREMVFFQSVQEGQLKDEEFNGRYVLLKYNKWQIGLPLEVFSVEIEKAKNTEKHLKFVECQEGAPVKFGNHFDKLFNEGLLGGQFSSEDVSYEVFMEIVQLFNEIVSRDNYTNEK